MPNSYCRLFYPDFSEDIAKEIPDLTDNDACKILNSLSSTTLILKHLPDTDIQSLQTQTDCFFVKYANDSCLLSGSRYSVSTLADKLSNITAESIRLSLSGIDTKWKVPECIYNAGLPELDKRTYVMGILNVTPDSFSDGGEHYDLNKAVDHAFRMLDEGADIIDIGGESTRPGAAPVVEQEEITRVVPAIESILKKRDAVISVDTYKSAVAKAAVESGARIINDISSGDMDPHMPQTASECKCLVILMHMKGTPGIMQQSPTYNNVIGEVYDYLVDRVSVFVQAGCDTNAIILDPGFGFGKIPEHNLDLIRRLREFRSMNKPLLMGTSRKSTIGSVLGGLPVSERLEGTAATVSLSIANGADIIRVHDVKEMVRVAKMTDSIVRR